MSCKYGEFAQKCIMWSHCTGYRQILGKLRCCPKLDIPARYWWKQQWRREISQESRKYNSRRKPSQTNWPALFCHNWETNWMGQPKPWPAKSHACDFSNARRIWGQPRWMVGGQIEERKVSPQTPLPKKESLSSSCSSSSCLIPFLEIESS